MVEDRALDELQDFTSWLSENRADGFIGEVGWPRDTGDADQWNHLAERWMQHADASGLWVTAWATGEWWPQDYRLAIYTASDSSGLDTVHSQAVVLERHLAHPGRGVNVAGAEFAAPSVAPKSAFSNRNAGTYGVDYHYDSQETFDFLARRGVGMVRIPFRWERLQPRLGRPLSKLELQRLADAVQRAGTAGLEVVLDMHNYGAYYKDRNGHGIRRAIGTTRCTTADFADVWRRLSRRFDDNRTVIGYGLMNEPIGIPPTDRATPARRWERISQRVLNTIRARHDVTTILVPGYEWSGVQSWRQNHPDGWITDPANQFRYEAHHYWDRDHSGTYVLSYDEENTP
ncbi:MAG: glycoside hydrolase family 5 protein [Actinomycetota bacterium]|nr:glycoside hydrolase family 5 protein [Actinomycetota bacterium]